MKKRSLSRLAAVCLFLACSLALLVPPVLAADPKAALAARVEAQKEALWKMSDWMYYNPEPGHKEFEAVKLLTGYLKDNGFEVEVGVKNLDPKWVPVLQTAWKMSELPTAFKATYAGAPGGPTIGFIVEYDALRGAGGKAFQGCQHNLQAPIGLGAAVALAQTMKEHDLPGKVVVFGTPAEEIPPPVKAIMFDSGVFNGVDVILAFHGTDKTTYNLPGRSALALEAEEYIFHGKPAHAAAGPWNGRSALDAVLLFYHGMEILREHSDPAFRMHGNITDGGAAPNVVPERAATNWMIRHPNGKMVAAQMERVKKIAEGAAMATETTVEINFQGRYDNKLNVSALENRAFEYEKQLGATNQVLPTPGPDPNAASTDLGTVAMNIPTISLSVQSAPAGTAGHSQENADATITPLAHHAMVIAAKVQAWLAWDLLTDPAYLAQVKAEHAELQKK
ncbi:MAG: amidohydrolase [Chitinophagales bacterium]